MGWIEHGRLAWRDLSSGTTTLHGPGEADHCRLYEVDGERFGVAEHAPKQDLLRLSVRTFAEPDEALWSLTVVPGRQELQGDPAHAAGLQRCFLATYANGGQWINRLAMLAPDYARASLHELSWYNRDNYDLDYQGLVDCVELPVGTPVRASAGGTAVRPSGNDLEHADALTPVPTEQILISIQRCSTVVIHDLAMAHLAGKIELAGRYGNPMLHIVDGELWAMDYDTFIRVNLVRHQGIKRVLLQPAHGGTQQFVGDLFHWRAAPGTGRSKLSGGGNLPWESAADSLVAIPRPFSGDIALLDPYSGRIKSNLHLGSQPLACVITAAGRVIARDWQSGAWLEGQVN